MTAGNWRIYIAGTISLNKQQENDLCDDLSYAESEIRSLNLRIESLRSDLQMLVAAAKRVEWSIPWEQFFCCPECGHKKPDGHRKDCDLGNALDGMKATS